MIETSTGKNCVVTGGTSGIGAAIAEGLAALGMRVIIIGRSASAGNALAERLSKDYATDVLFQQADLSSIQDVERLASCIAGLAASVDVLVNCASGVFEDRRTSVDGLEYTLALNHLGPLQLTLLLEPMLQQSPKARIINVAADPKMLSAQPPDADDLEMKKAYSGVKAYMRSKNLNVISTYQLARRLADSAITVNAYHPGIVRTSLAQHLSLAKRMAVWLASPFLLSPAQGADTGVWLATSDEVDGISGKFFVKRQKVLSAPCTYDSALSEKIWNRSMRMLGRDSR